MARLPPLRDPHRHLYIGESDRTRPGKLPPLRERAPPEPSGESWKPAAMGALLRHHFREKVRREEARKVPVVAPPAAQRIAKLALEIRAKLPPSKRGGLTTRQAGKEGVGSGVARARDIIAGKQLDARQIVRFFARFGPRIERAKLQGHTMATSKVLQADGLWGGDPMRVAAQRAVDAADPAKTSRTSSRAKRR